MHCAKNLSELIKTYQNFALSINAKSECLTFALSIDDNASYEP